MRSYLFHGSDPLACAWHPAGRVFAAGCVDGTVRVWDTAAAVSASRNAFGSNQFDLPLALDVPANDVPLHTLRDHRGPVLFLAFGGAGRWLASIDAVGYLRIHAGFSRESLPQLLPVTPAHEATGEPSGAKPILAVETRLDRASEIIGLETFEERLVVRRRGGASEEFHFVPGELPAETHVAFGVTELAWNGDATELCAITLTDIHWLQVSPLELLCAAQGKNPIGVSHAAGRYWAVPTDSSFVEQQLIHDNGKWRSSNDPMLTLSVAVKGQGARTRMTAAGDGRIAVYRGQRIQFFHHHQAAPTNSSIIVQRGGGEDREIFWNYSGTLLGTTVRVTNGLHLETWTTSKEFPPECRALPSVKVDCERIMPANRGQQYVARSVRRGLFIYDAGARTETILDNSSMARQNGPLSVTADGEFLAVVTDRNVIQIVKLPGGRPFAELQSRRPRALTSLCWDKSGHHLAGTTEDGHVQVWKLAQWQDWLARHGLEK